MSYFNLILIYLFIVLWNEFKNFEIWKIWKKSEKSKSEFYQTWSFNHYDQFDDEPADYIWSVDATLETFKTYTTISCCFISSKIELYLSIIYLSKSHAK